MLDGLITYHAFTIRKAKVNDLNGEEPSWASAETVKHSLSEADVLKKIRILSKTNRSVTEKQADLSTLQRGQIRKLMDDLKTKNSERDFEWTLRQIEQKGNRYSFGGILDIESITVFLQRSPRKEVKLSSAVHRTDEVRPLRLSSGNKENQQERPNNDTPGSLERIEPKIARKPLRRLDIPQTPSQGSIAAGLPFRANEPPKQLLPSTIKAGKQATVRDEIATVSSVSPSIYSDGKLADDVSISTDSHGRGMAVRSKPSANESRDLLCLVSVIFALWSQPMIAEIYAHNQHHYPVQPLSHGAV
jgi:hypothetical protein